MRVVLDTDVVEAGFSSPSGNHHHVVSSGFGVIAFADALGGVKAANQCNAVSS